MEHLYIQIAGRWIRWDHEVCPACHGLSTQSLLSEILPELRPPTFPNEPMADDKPLKLLLPSLKFHDFLAFLSFEGLSLSMSSFFILATTNWAILLRQKGHTGAVRHAVVGLGLLWQHRANVQWAHIWWPQSWTSIVQTWSKQMQHSSFSLACGMISQEWELDNAWCFELSDMVRKRLILQKLLKIVDMRANQISAEESHCAQVVLIFWQSRRS